MISLKKIKELSKKYRKKMSKKAIKRINEIIEKEVERIIKGAAKNSDFAGRKIIKREDINGNLF